MSFFCDSCCLSTRLPERVFKFLLINEKRRRKSSQRHYCIVSAAAWVWLFIQLIHSLMFGPHRHSLELKYHYVKNNFCSYSLKVPAMYILFCFNIIIVFLKYLTLSNLHCRIYCLLSKSRLRKKLSDIFDLKGISMAMCFYGCQFNLLQLQIISCLIKTLKKKTKRSDMMRKPQIAHKSELKCRAATPEEPGADISHSAFFHPPQLFLWLRVLTAHHPLFLQTTA